ncbi:MAG: hypothetical protein PUP92_31485 [Rhizonema sp. PD38]|nr:hypothetical protein [Rhizonema sp. PD38]
MYQADDSRFPLIVVMMQGHFTLKEAQAYLQQWNRWLAREKPMAVLNLIQDEQPPQENAEAAKYYAQWLKANKSRLRQHLKGIAQVMHSEAYSIFESKFPALIGRLYGCSGKLFLQQSEAEAWLMQKLLT